MRTKNVARTAVVMLLALAAAAYAKDEKKGKGDSEKAEGKRWSGDGISWAVPEGWTQQEGQGPRFATLVAGEGDERVEVTITRFPGDVGGVLANVNRWRGQIGLGPVGEDELKDQTTEIEVDGQTALMVDMTGEGADAKRLAAAMIRRGDQTWFVKMMGPSEAVGAQREALEAFVKSIDFDDDGAKGEV